ncbi:MAG: glycoside hydrolase, partial [Candidatus Adiutrix sp.]|nr:glycoside hydrolase [Candidatus Adiutrix sp.]
MPGSRYLIIHGHFYQPPRENPWILAIEPQASAAPFNDWNQRIDRECYAPNGWARFLDEKGLISRLVNNYEHLSFNFGPTLLSWMAKAAPETYHRLILADRQATMAHGGHGSALAQVYNHLIMPLANHRDRLTQIRWGLMDFESRFGRRPEGLWLAETAVDLETLALLAREGLKFTILSQGQASAVRPLAGGPDGPWQEVTGGRIDPREPYRVFWGSGPADYIDLFFYDGPVSRSIAFDRLLSDGQALLRRIEEAFGLPNDDGRPRLVNLATDGESYGHHFKFGEMALAWVFSHLEETAGQPGAIQL